MGDYGQAAVKATQLIASGKESSPVTAWDRTTSASFGKGTSSQMKSCPRDAYLGLCESGLVRGIPSGSYTKSQMNKLYSVTAVQLIKAKPSLGNLSERDLWTTVLKHLRRNTGKTYNQQMDVVLALFHNGLV